MRPRERTPHPGHHPAPESAPGTWTRPLELDWHPLQLALGAAAMTLVVALLDGVLATVAVLALLASQTAWNTWSGRPGRPPAGTRPTRPTWHYLVAFGSLLATVWLSVVAADAWVGAGVAFALGLAIGVWHRRGFRRADQPA